jgi:hypothetical protein
MHTKDLQSTLVRVGWTYHYDDITGGCLCRSYIGVILGLLSISTHGEHISEAKFGVFRVFQGRHNAAISRTIPIVVLIWMSFPFQVAMFNCHIRLLKKVQLSQLTGNQWPEAFGLLQEIETQWLGRTCSVVFIQLMVIQPWFNMGMTHGFTKSGR